MYILPKFLLQYSSYYTLKIHSPLKHFCKIGINPLHNYTVKWSEMKSLSRVRLFMTPWTVACQAPLSIGFSRQEYWSGLPFPSPGDLPNPGIEPVSPALQTDTLPSEPPGAQHTICRHTHYVKITTVIYPKSHPPDTYM